MAINSVSNSNRLLGLASGFDTESIVKNLMQIEQLKLNRELRAKTKLEWKQDALKGVSTDLKTFKNTYLTGLGADGMLKSSAYTSYKVALSGDKKDAVSISANAEAFASKITVNKITSLAAGAKAESTGRVSLNGTQLSEGNHIALGELEFANDLFTDGDEISFAINGEEFTFTKDTTLQQMLTTVNNSDAGVTMTYSRLTDGFSITSKDTGAEQTLTIENKTGNAFGANSAFGIAEAGEDNPYSGANAVAYINGVRVERESNTFTIDGIKYTLNDVTGTETEAEKTAGKLIEDDSSSRITATLTKDIDAAYNNIKSFIDGYNTMIAKLNSMLSETKYSDYYALTDDEKAEMTEAQITQWEGFAQSGLLRNDRDIQNLLDNMRSAFYSTVEGAGLSPQEIGLKSGNYFTSGKGQIEIDETTLRAALEKDSDAVMKVFMDGSNSTNAAERGLIWRLSDAIGSYTKTLENNTLDSLDSKLSKLADKISAMETRMADLEERYYAKYTAMETALSKMNSQSNWLSSMLGTSSS